MCAVQNSVRWWLILVRIQWFSNAKSWHKCQGMSNENVALIFQRPQGTTQTYWKDVMTTPSSFVLASLSFKQGLDCWMILTTFLTPSMLARMVFSTQKSDRSISKSCKHLPQMRWNMLTSPAHHGLVPTPHAVWETKDMLDPRRQR